jgi:hypothetical protein
MSDGATVVKSIPAAVAIGEEELTADPRFPYKLYETNELEFSAVSPADSEPADPQQQPIDLEAIEQAARTSGLIYRRKPDRIIVRSPYTC